MGESVIMCQNVFLSERQGLRPWSDRETYAGSLYHSIGFLCDECPEKLVHIRDIKSMRLRALGLDPSITAGLNQRGWEKFLDAFLDAHCVRKTTLDLDCGGQEYHVEALAQFFKIEIVVMEFDTMRQVFYGVRNDNPTQRIFLLRDGKRYSPIVLSRREADGRKTSQKRHWVGASQLLCAVGNAVGQRLGVNAVPSQWLETCYYDTDADVKNSADTKTDSNTSSINVETQARQGDDMFGTPYDHEGDVELGKFTCCGKDMYAPGGCPGALRATA